MNACLGKMFDLKAWPLLAIFLALTATGCSSRHPIAERVELILSTATLEPTTTFELRFDDELVTPADVGKPARLSPLLIQPPLAGTFIWMSQRSIIFTPTEPMMLGRGYRFTLHAGLRSASGHPLTARLDQTLVTPAFSLLPFNPSWYVRTNAPAQPQ
ncbi:MAG TPA: hypothetical protein VK633_07820, partial [Verrucomicrobiae bacterium]|nr:hypothetical protein [Verrucomicrobiae bacterium]